MNKKELKTAVVKIKKATLHFEDIDRVREQIRAIQHPLRLKFVEYISNNPGTNVTGIYKTNKVEQAVASQMLSMLKKAGLVYSKPNGKEQLYHVNYDALTALNDRCK